MLLTKREYVALELLKVKDITVVEAYEMADSFITESFLKTTDDIVHETSDKNIDKDSSLDTIFLLGVEILELSVGATTFFKDHQIKTIEKLVLSKISDLFPTDRYNNIFSETLNRLKKIGLSFGMEKYELLDYNSAEYVKIIKGTEGEFILRPVP